MNHLPPVDKPPSCCRRPLATILEKRCTAHVLHFGRESLHWWFSICKVLPQLVSKHNFHISSLKLARERISPMNVLELTTTTFPSNPTTLLVPLSRIWKMELLFGAPVFHSCPRRASFAGGRFSDRGFLCLWNMRACQECERPVNLSRSATTAGCRLGRWGQCFSIGGWIPGFFPLNYRILKFVNMLIVNVINWNSKPSKAASIYAATPKTFLY